MTRLRLVSYSVLRKVAEEAGFIWVRSVGSHNTFRNQKGEIIVIPDHGSQVIVRPLLRKLLRDMRLTIDEYHAILDKVK